MSFGGQSPLYPRFGPGERIEGNVLDRAHRPVPDQ